MSTTLAEHSADRQVEIIEVYVPAQLRYLARLYEWLANELEGPKSRALFHGFSLYEVDGAFRGRRQVYHEKTLVVRLVFDLPGADDSASRASTSYESRIRDITDAVVKITLDREEELWIIRAPARRVVRSNRG